MTNIIGADSSRGHDESIEKLSYGMREHAPGFLNERHVYFTSPPPGREWDPAIVAAVREFDPYFVPLWVVKIFGRPKDDADNYEEVTFGRHVLARKVPDPFHEKLPITPLVQNSAKNIYPNVLLEFLEDNRPDMKELGESDLPGKYLPFGWNVYQGLRKDYQHTNKKASTATLQIREDRLEAQARERKFLKDDFEYGRQEHSKWFQKKIDEIPEWEALAYFKAKSSGGIKRDVQPYAFMHNTKEVS